MSVLWARVNACRPVLWVCVDSCLGARHDQNIPRQDIQQVQELRGREEGKEAGRHAREGRRQGKGERKRGGEAKGRPNGMREAGQGGSNDGESWRGVEAGRLNER